ncbi:MAG: ATP-binding protein, partial [Candidatus Methanomethyliales bacterium]|nr:ATP-binding protein [Candidatus Methanomethylicales archaeon]
MEEKFKRTKVIEREVLSKLKEVMGSNLVKVTTGIRRSGKSFLTYSLLKDSDFGYVNFDEPILLNALAEDVLSSLIEIYGRNLKVIFLDEIQNLEDWELFVNKLQRSGYNVFITGSSAKLLSRELSTHLTGRHIPIEVFPFSFREYLKSVGFNEDLETTRGISLVKHELLNYIERGGFPEVVVEKENPRIYLRQLYNDIIEKDIIFRYNIAYKTTFREIALTALSNFGRQVTYNSLKKQFGLRSDHTAKNYLSYLNESYLIFYINKLSFKPREIEMSPKKIYCIDTGIIKTVSVGFREDFGRIMEDLVAIELLRRRSYWLKGADIYYWRDYQQNEVDFVMKEGTNAKQLIQVTYASGRDEIEKREIRAMIKASEQLNCRDLLIITWD